MPRARIATAAVLLAALGAAVFWLPTAGAVAVFLAVVGLAAREWAALAGLAHGLPQHAYALVVVALCALSWWASGPHVPAVALACGMAWWLLAAAWIIGYQQRGRPAAVGVGWMSLAGLAVFLPALAAIAWLLGQSPWHLLAMLAIVWSADIFAYVGGRRFGRRRLISRVSPGKTWEGLLSAVGATLMLALAINAAWLGMAYGPLLLLVAATLAAAVIGDLLESLAKRLRGVKDSGTLLPGHGGVLDRIDSVVAAAPVFAFVYLEVA
ncbi:MAG: phosphatidate cytidylyltransferase [Gammaproteobacteria bacterium]